MNAHAATAPWLARLSRGPIFASDIFRPVVAEAAA
jgi:hypothetical protein